jgi:aspartate aminotransferase
MTTIQSQSTSNPCSISQAAAAAALDGPQDCVREMCEAYRRRHDYIVGALNDIEGIRCHPGDGAFYVFPRIEEASGKLGLKDDIAFTEYLLEKADLACVPGSAFGAPGYLRISYACSLAALEDAVARLKRALSA